MAIYTYIKDIDRGGFARVLLVQNEYGVLFAMKVLDPSPQLAHVPIDQIKRRFEREVKYQQALHHPNIVSIVDVDTNNNPPYCVMEFATGGTLAKDLAFDHTLAGNPKPALFDILSGLDFLAKKGIIHRDLKPQNVLKFLNSDGTFRYAISDFGLMDPGATDSTTLTVTGAQGGTAFYAAPELMQDFSRATVRADIYSFGAILHDIFVAQPRIPYTKLTASPPIGPILEKCTETNPSRRYASISELREDLFAALSTAQLFFTSSKEQRAVELLGEHRDLSSDEWDKIFLALDENEAKSTANDNIFRALRNEHIVQLNQDSLQLVKSLGMRYCKFAMSQGFEFSYCDIISAKLETLFAIGDIELKAFVLLALLELGVSHNRWAVERAFYHRTMADADANVINRFLLEVQVRGYPIKMRIQHLLVSISANAEFFHSLLKAALA
ncbi:serine/threonine-protein kinase [Methylobacter sp. Wu1]|uniref:serine/threonine-protein kinase n=1 Tax=Methylobacter sp. Wu1 TaxID=3119359 RepID=UPI002F958CEF